MSQALAHFAFGAAMTTLVVTLFVPGLKHPRTVVLGGGGWAMLPDLHWVSPVASERLREIHATSPWTDLFWFHRTLDRLDPGDSHEVAALILAVFIVATLVAERRDYRTPAVVEDALESHLETGDDD